MDRWAPTMPPAAMAAPLRIGTSPPWRAMRPPPTMPAPVSRPEPETVEPDWYQPRPMVAAPRSCLVCSIADGRCGDCLRRTSAPSANSRASRLASSGLSASPTTSALRVRRQSLGVFASTCDGSGSPSAPTSVMVSHPRTARSTTTAVTCRAAGVPSTIAPASPGEASTGGWNWTATSPAYSGVLSRSRTVAEPGGGNCPGMVPAKISSWKRRLSSVETTQKRPTARMAITIDPSDALSIGLLSDGSPRVATGS